MTQCQKLGNTTSEWRIKEWRRLGPLRPKIKNHPVSQKLELTAVNSWNSPILDGIESEILLFLGNLHVALQLVTLIFDWCVNHN